MLKTHYILFYASTASLFDFALTVHSRIENVFIADVVMGYLAVKNNRFKLKNPDYFAKR